MTGPEPSEGRGARIYLRLLRHVLPYRAVFALGVLGMVVLAATEPAIPALLKPTFDGSFVDKDRAQVALMTVLFVAVFVVRGAAQFLSAIALAWVSGKLVMDLRSAVFGRLERVPASYFDEHATGNLISKVTFDAAQVAEASTYVLTVLVRDSLALLGLTAWMLYLDWQMSLAIFLVVPVIALVVRYFTRRLRRMSHLLQDSMGEVTRVMEEFIRGQRVVRTFGGQEFERGRFARAATRARHFQMKFLAASNAAAPIAQILVASMVASILYIASGASARGEMTVGGFVSFMTAMALMFAPIKRLTGVNGRLQKGIAASQSVFGIADAAPEADPGTRRLARAAGALAFEDVSFTYANAAEPALDGVSLRIEPGETVALVGHSGSGKTTLAALAPRFYTPDRGRVLVDGTDAAEYTLGSLRESIAVVDQDVVLFNDSVRANIAYGRLADAPREAVVAAARAAQAWEFIERLPQGLETSVGERGDRLSAGQRQRIALARAFLKDAPILILDEATSALDAATERDLQAALERLREGRSVLVIAHRLATVERADRIVVLDRGRVVETGTHRALLARDGAYAALCRFQLTDAPDGEPAATAG